MVRGNVSLSHYGELIISLYIHFILMWSLHHALDVALLFQNISCSSGSYHKPIPCGLCGLADARGRDE